MGGAFDWRGDKAQIQEQLGTGVYVFMTGGGDSARGEVRRAYQQYKRAGLEHVKLFDPRDIRHELPKRKDFAAALSFMSERFRGLDKDQ